MAKYEHLPIYKKSMDLAVHIHDCIKNFSRYNKYTIGTDLRNISREIMKLIVRANSAIDKIDVLVELVETCEMMKIMLMFAKETKAFQNFKSFQIAIGLATSLCKQSEGWLQSSRKKSQNYQPSSKTGR